mmetsp:Transcript_64719/g.94787  ORF Transcript_64719/g.94787 Transcript_64719/m.94787 type:complete len:220 (-) Transcript_64719:40-699(-)
MMLGAPGGDKRYFPGRYRVIVCRAVRNSIDSGRFLSAVQYMMRRVVNSVNALMPGSSWIPQLSIVSSRKLVSDCVEIGSSVVPTRFRRVSVCSLVNCPKHAGSSLIKEQSESVSVKRLVKCPKEVKEQDGPCRTSSRMLVSGAMDELGFALLVLCSRSALEITCPAFSHLGANNMQLINLRIGLCIDIPSAANQVKSNQSADRCLKRSDDALVAQFRLL